MTFVVAEECLRLGLRAGAVVFRNVRVAASGDDLRTEMTRQVATIRYRFADANAVRSAAEVAPFQEILRSVGVNPRREPSSVERLLGLAVKRGELPAVNNLVDAYNLVSVRSFCSLGAHDLDRIALPVTLRLFTGNESFTPLGRDSAEPVTPGEFGYVDARERVLCRLDLRQADFSKVTEAARNVLLIVEGTASHSLEVLRQAIDDVIAGVTQHCGGSAEVAAMP